MAAMGLRLRDITEVDLPLIDRWLHADPVRSTWGDREFDDVPHGLHWLLLRHRQDGQTA